MKSSAENKNRNRNQHYVPENYFKEFSMDGSSICALFKKNGKLETKVAIGGQSSGEWFYGDAGREEEVTIFDTKYFKNRRDILDALAEGATTLTSEQFDTLLENTQFQRERTLASRRAEHGVRKFYEDFFEPQIEGLENYESGHSEEATEAVKVVMKQVFKSFSDPKDSQFLRLVRIDKEDVSDLNLVILRNCTEYPFMFSDAPVVYSNPALSDFMCGKMGNSNVGLQIFYPLNSVFLALFYDPVVYTLGGCKSLVIDVANDKDIHNLNKLQLHEATNSVYFSNPKHAEYAKLLWHEERDNFELRNKSIESVPEINAYGNVTGRMSFTENESEPSFYPFLSFIAHDISNSSLPYREAFWRKNNPPGTVIPKINDQVDRYSDYVNCYFTYAYKRLIEEICKIRVGLDPLYVDDRICRLANLTPLDHYEWASEAFRRVQEEKPLPWEQNVKS